MACERWKELLVGALYDEIEPADRQRLEAHVDACDACRAEMVELEQARVSLRLAEPRVPASTRVVVLPDTGKWRLSWWSFAAGFACAALVLCVGVFAGMRYVEGGTGAVAIVPPAAEMSSDVVSRDELNRTLAAQHAEVEAMLGRRLSAYDERLPSVQQVNRRFQELERLAGEQRVNDLQFVMNEIFASEARAGVAIDKTQQTLRYLTLASHPDLSEW